MSISRLLVVFTLVICLPFHSRGFSVLTHLGIVDACWQHAIEPVLLKKYPGSTAEQLKDAHAYTYGGAIMPDMGYYPFGAVLFTNLVHYVRSGDFVQTMLAEAADLNEYAFALGALCHYNADVYGHSIGINPSAPLIYPKIREKYGDTVYYVQDKISHIRTELGFDVLQAARGNYASQSYHDFIGFKVAKPVLERSFLKTYGLDINNVFRSFSLAVGSFRFTVRNLFPTITKIAWASRSEEIKKINAQATKKNFRYRMKRKEYYAGKKNDYKPGFFTGAIAILFKVLPKVGPLRAFKFKVPNTQAEAHFLRSFDAVVTNYSSALHKLPSTIPDLSDRDFDTGKKTMPGEYKLCDDTYHRLLVTLNNDRFSYVDTALKANLLFYYDHAAQVVGQQPCKKQRKINCAIEALQATSVAQ